jgi:hypothetical protein
VQLIPGNEIVQRLIRPLLERRIETLQIQVGTQTIPVGLTNASQEAMSDIHTTSQQVTDSLQVIAPAPAPEAAPAPSLPAAQPAAPAPPSGAPPEAPPSSAPSSPSAPSTSTR